MVSRSGNDHLVWCFFHIYANCLPCLPEGSQIIHQKWGIRGPFVWIIIDDNWGSTMVYYPYPYNPLDDHS